MTWFFVLLESVKNKPKEMFQHSILPQITKKSSRFKSQKFCVCYASYTINLKLHCLILQKIKRAFSLQEIMGIRRIIVKNLPAGVKAGVIMDRLVKFYYLMH
jgi:hypothetical protein